MTAVDGPAAERRPGIGGTLGGPLGGMKFAHRVALMPGLAAVGLLAVLAVSQIVGDKTGNLLDSVEKGYSPALETARDLEETLAAIQRGLEAAVREKSNLNEVEALRGAFLESLDKAAANPTMPADQTRAIRTAFNSYYGLAEQNSLAMIGGATGEALVTSLNTMRDRYLDIVRRLKEATARSKHDMKQASAAARDNQRLSMTVILVITVVLALALAALSFLVIHSLTVPLGQVVAVARGLAGGDLSGRIEIRSHDEIGELSLAMTAVVDYLRDMASVADAIALGDLRGGVEPRSDRDAFGQAFQKMTGNLRSVLGDLKGSSAQVAATADEISASALQIKRGAESQSSSTEETSSTMVEMASQIDSINRSTQALASNVEETSTSIQQMGTSIEEVAKSSERLLGAVEDTATTIEQMTSSIDAIRAKVDVVDQVSREAAQAAGEGGERLSGVIRGIGASGKDIGKIVKIIDDIADQTNLLALNAAIEAARAGDAGRGFAVVADEIKRLAERSMNSTREISTFIESMQKDTEEAVDLSQRVLRQIVEAVQRTTDLVQNVQTATQEQSNGAAQILRTTGSMQMVTQQLATGAREQAQGAKQIMTTSTLMNRMTQQVADATSEQIKGGDQVVKAVDQIAQVAQQFLSATEQLSNATQSLALEAERLKGLSAVFQV
ncbi:MAG: methyl-accepting chemotaxis protein [Acidobacteriota bacterium]|nr:methyl-accepting chemotaxis protein [Acidobacteriota bacterium]